MSVERFLLLNFSINLAVLMVSVRAVGQLRMRRIALAALLGTLYALAAYLPGGRCLRSPWAQVICLITLGCVSCPTGTLLKRARACLSLCVCAAMTGGTQLALRRERLSVPLLLATLLLYALFSDARRQLQTVRTVRLRLWLDRQCVPVTALVDSGNCLHEPISGLPVLIVHAQYLTGRLGSERLRRLTQRGRWVRYRSLNSSGEMLCLRAERLEILERGRRRSAGDVYVALCEHSFSGEHQAIAPVSIYDEA